MAMMDACMGGVPEPIVRNVDVVAGALLEPTPLGGDVGLPEVPAGGFLCVGPGGFEDAYRRHVPEGRTALVGFTVAVDVTDGRWTPRPAMAIVGPSGDILLAYLSTCWFRQGGRGLADWLAGIRDVDCTYRASCVLNRLEADPGAEGLIREMCPWHLGPVALGALCRYVRPLNPDADGAIATCMLLNASRYAHVIALRPLGTERNPIGLARNTLRLLETGLRPEPENRLDMHNRTRALNALLDGTTPEEGTTADMPLVRAAVKRVAWNIHNDNGSAWARLTARERMDIEMSYQLLVADEQGLPYTYTYADGTRVTNDGREYAPDHGMPGELLLEDWLDRQGGDVQLWFENRVPPDRGAR